MTQRDNNLKVNADKREQQISKNIKNNVNYLKLFYKN